MTKPNSNVFIEFTDFRGPVMVRASSIDAAIADTNKDGATKLFINGNCLVIELPYIDVIKTMSQADIASRVYPEKTQTIFHPLKDSTLQKQYSEHGELIGAVATQDNK
ncbi:hypothetical protein [Hafnia sp.]|uniref:hypothetical protein n=1 Tax=Hafnia sp. TaxID=1873498 RepID=UPI002FC73C80